jgi:hypothetical protein
MLRAAREALIDPATGEPFEQRSYQRRLFVRLSLPAKPGRQPLGHMEAGRNMVPVPLLVAASFVSRVGLDDLAAIAYAHLSPADRQTIAPPVGRRLVSAVGARQLGDELVAAMRDDTWSGMEVQSAEL